MAIQVKNGSSRLTNEIWELKKHNKPLLKVLLATRNFVKKNFGKDITLTMIYRTDDEQDNIYRGKSRRGRFYDVNPWKSPHQFYAAFDLRSRTFTSKEIDTLVSYLNDKYNKTNYFRFTAMCHDIGLGSHFHVQYKKKQS